jgi:hypothetical protein
MIANTRRFLGFVLLLAIAWLSFAASGQQAAQNPRIALVIGNATYRDAALSTTANDAGLIAQTLQAAGFDVVGARDLDGQSLRTAFRDFLDKAAAAGPDMQAFVYLAGRGVQYNGDNYFVPVDAQINRDADVPIDALPFPTSPMRWRRRRGRPGSSCSMPPAQTRTSRKGPRSRRVSRWSIRSRAN